MNKPGDRTRSARPQRAADGGGGAPSRRTRRSVLRRILGPTLASGAAVGLALPLFARAALHTPESVRPAFFALCVAAGLAVGMGGFLIFRREVTREFSRLASAMRRMEEEVRAATDGGEPALDACRLPVSSADVIGDAAAAFNDMARTFGVRIRLESATRRLLARLAACDDLDAVSREILEAVGDVCDSKGGVLYGDTGRKLGMLASFGVDPKAELQAEVDGSQGLVRRSLTRRQVVCVCPSRDGFEWMSLSTPLGGFRPKAVVLVPLVAEQRPVGLIALACSRDRLTEEQALLLDSLRAQAAPYLRTAVLHEKLRDLAAVDDLTSLLNRRFGMRRLAEEFLRAARHGVPLSVIMVDIDRFKEFNDAHGHDAGDAALVSVARILEAGVRAGDVVCRYGGEELLIVAQGSGMNDAASFAERVRRLVEATPVMWRDQQLRVTVSLGTATWPIVRASLPEEMVTFAEAALHHAKSSGRNQVSVHQGKDVTPVSALGPDPQ